MQYSIIRKKNDNTNGKHNSLTLLVSFKNTVPKQSANSELEWNKAWTTGMTGKTGVTKMTGMTKMTGRTGVTKMTEKTRLTGMKRITGMIRMTGMIGMLVFTPKYWANLFNYTFFVLFFCLLLHCLAISISLPFHIFPQVVICTDPGLQLGDPAPLISLTL